MSSRNRWLVLPAMLAAGFWLACSVGEVGQGRVISYDKKAGTLRVIEDSNRRGKGNPKYDVLPPVTLRTPADPGEMGPAPETGKLLLLDRPNKRVVVFDSAAGDLKTIAYSPVEEQTGVFPDDARVTKVKFPIIDRQKKTITVYSPPERALVTFTVAEEFLALPDDTWKSGDEVRYYYKQPGQALRLMNVTRTDINKGK